MGYKWRGLLMTLVVVLQAGCGPRQAELSRHHRVQLKRRAMECLKAGIRYTPNPAVRTEAVEALESCGIEESLPWIRSALLDDHAVVRFAACAAIGRMKDATSASILSKLANDDNASVRVAALFALHRIGDTRKTGMIPTYLLNHDDPKVRRNAAIILGLMEEHGAIKILARAMRDVDPGVRHYALEAMARLGNSDARQELTFMSSAGVGAEEVFALHALAQTRDRMFLDTFRYKLATAYHLETRLAAAHGLGNLGSDDGFKLALGVLRGDYRAPSADPEDHPGAHALRVRQLAARALGAIGRTEALSVLAGIMDDPSDPRVQVPAAQAILEIISANDDTAFSPRPETHGR